MDLSPWEKATSGVLNGLRLSSIRGKILLFALVATLVPTVTMGWLSYHNNRAAIEAKTAQELTHLTSQASREMELWLKERQYEIRVFSSSYEITENLVALQAAAGTNRELSQALRRVQDYLRSVAGKFVDFDELLVIDARGVRVASSSEIMGDFPLEPQWKEQILSGEPAIEPVFAEDVLAHGMVILTEPVRGLDGTFLGALAARLRVDGTDTILRDAVGDSRNHGLHLVTRRGTVLATSKPTDSPFVLHKLDTSTSEQLFESENSPHPVDFSSVDGVRVLGRAKSLPLLAWGVVGETDRANAYAGITHLRNLTILLIVVVMVVMGITAYLLGLTIVRPLQRLAHGVAKVAAGDLDVELPSFGGGEVGYMTDVFNQMVDRLRQVREQKATITRALHEKNSELQRLSSMDMLTGLYTRAHFNDILAREFDHSRDQGQSFAVLMLDIDHFKSFNDTFGHQAGDAVLRTVGQIIIESVRECDHAARFGGEEFIVLLTEVTSDQAMEAAEFIRSRVDETGFLDDAVVTLSAGVASYPDHAEEIEQLVHVADAALYRAKAAGRNCAILARKDDKIEPGTEAATSRTIAVVEPAKTALVDEDVPSTSSSL